MAPKLPKNTASSKTKTVYFNQDTWTEKVSSKKPGQTLAMVEGISMSMPQDVKEKMKHYQYGESFTSKCLAITELSPLPEHVYFVVTGELHRHNLKVKYNLSEKKALAAGQEESQFWITHHEKIAREILGKMGIKVSIFTWQDFLNSEAFEATCNRVKNDFYQTDPVFRHHIEALCTQNVKSALMRNLERTVDELTRSANQGNPSTKLKDAIKLLQNTELLTDEKLPAEDAAADAKTKFFNQQLKPLFSLFKQARNSSLFLLTALTEEDQNLSNTVETISNFSKSAQYLPQWALIIQTARTIQSAYQAQQIELENKYREASRTYLLEEAASADWIANLGGENTLIINTYNREENPAWGRAAYKLGKTIPFIPYRFKSTTPSNKLTKKSSPNRPIAVPQVEEPAQEESLFALRVLEQLRTLIESPEGQILLTKQDEVLTKQLFRLYAEIIEGLPESNEKSTLYTAAMQHTSAIKPELTETLLQILGSVMTGSKSSTPPASPDHQSTRQASISPKAGDKRRGSAHQAMAVFIRGVTLFNRRKSSISTERPLFSTIKMLEVLQELTAEQAVIAFLKEENNQELKVEREQTPTSCTQKILECYMDIIKSLPEGDAKTKPLTQLMDRLRPRNAPALRAIIGSALRETTPPSSPNHHAGNSALTLPLHRLGLGSALSSRGTSPSSSIRQNRG